MLTLRLRTTAYDFFAVQMFMLTIFPTNVLLLGVTGMALWPLMGGLGSMIKPVQLVAILGLLLMVIEGVIAVSIGALSYLVGKFGKLRGLGVQDWTVDDQGTNYKTEAEETRSTWVGTRAYETRRYLFLVRPGLKAAVFPKAQLGVPDLARLRQYFQQHARLKRSRAMLTVGALALVGVSALGVSLLDEDYKRTTHVGAAGMAHKAGQTYVWVAETQNAMAENMLRMALDAVLGNMDAIVARNRVRQRLHLWDVGPDGKGAYRVLEGQRLHPLVWKDGLYAMPEGERPQGMMRRWDGNAFVETASTAQEYYKAQARMPVPEDSVLVEDESRDKRGQKPKGLMRLPEHDGWQQWVLLVQQPFTVTERVGTRDVTLSSSGMPRDGAGMEFSLSGLSAGLDRRLTLDPRSTPITRAEFESFPVMKLPANPSDLSDAEALGED